MQTLCSFFAKREAMRPKYASVEVCSDNGTHHFLTIDLIAVTAVHTCIVHEHDACGAGLVGMEIVKKGSVGVDGIVAIAVAGRDIVAKESRDLGVSRTEVEYPHDVGGLGSTMSGAEIEHTGHGCGLDVECPLGIR